MNTNYAQLASDTVLDDKSRLLRTLVLDALEGGGRGHLASALSLIEIVRVLYDDILVHDSNNPLLPNRDRFVLSKGHGCLGLFAVMADHGYFSNEQPAFGCQPAFGSHSQWLVGGVFFAFFIMHLHEPLVCMMKKVNLYT
jgi:transketolase